MAGKLTPLYKNTFRDFLTVCQVRGRDATGVVIVDQNDKYNYLKAVGTPEFLTDTKAYDRTVEQGTRKVVIGHCRAKTFGDNTRKNAHPFAHGDICGVHNGSLKWTHGLENFRDFEVDSDWIFWHISKYGIEETIPKLDNAGAWALNWWDENEKKLYFIRNKERPLWFTHSSDKEVMMWASEPWMFSAMTRRVGIDLWDGGEDKKVFYQMPENQLYAFSVDHNGKTPQEIFNLAPILEVKAEVRGYQGNHNRGGTGGYNRPGNVTVLDRGGEVGSPFQRTDLNDDVPNLGKTTLLEQHRQRRALMLNPDVSIVTDLSGRQSSKNSPKPSDSQTDAKISENTGDKSQSSTSPRSKLCLPGANGNNSNESGGSHWNCARPARQGKKVSLRTLHGIDYISDLGTSREFTEMKFEELTGGVCSYCKTAIGGLEEVHQLFIKPKEKDFEQMSFICIPCVNPNVA